MLLRMRLPDIAQGFISQKRSLSLLEMGQHSRVRVGFAMQ
jgi:hypothetical protein